MTLLSLHMVKQKKQKTHKNTRIDKSMKFLLLCLWTWVLLVLMGSGRSSKGCLEEERNALLKIKAAFNHPNGSSLPYWGEGDGDCCRWLGVVCDDATSRVAQLRLRHTREWGLPRPWVIDASLFLPLEELQELDLAWNSISDINGTQHLKKLKRLDLSNNNLKRISSLYMQTPVADQNLSSNQLEGVNLEELDLSGNYLVNDALTDITRITSLKALNIPFCGLNASKLLEGLCGLRKLEELIIHDNQFWGPLPSCFSNMTSLQQLDVSYNNFSGDIPSSLLSNLKSLGYIDFSGNAFEGSLSLASLANNSKLKTFRLLDNGNHLEVNTEEPTWFPSFQLKDFHLPDCVLNKDADGVIPSFLKEQHDLGTVDLSHSGMKGNFPNWLLANNANLEYLVLRGNNLSSALHWPANLSPGGMWYFDVSDNAIDGELPAWIGYVLPNLAYLNLSDNLLEGRIPSSMGYMQVLWALDLSYNNLTGEIPEPLAKNCSLLSALILSGNNLQGEMLPRDSNLQSLRYLYLDSNHFMGEISPGILNSSDLYVLDVSNNSLSGNLPNWIGDIKSLMVLRLSNNFFGGPLPLSFCNLQYLHILDLSSIKFGPNVLWCVNVRVVKFLHLSNDALTGHFPEFLLEASMIVTLDLRHNALSGEIPNWIASLRSLKFLLLQGNNFKGSIPGDLCLLKNMSILDLSNNYLSGKIPPCLKDLTFGNDGASTNLFADIYYEIQTVEGFSYFPTIVLEVSFMTKSRLESYKGHILQLMSGMDLSQNKLTGFIPPELGHLTGLRALNLSHNHLTGSIPETFSNLKNVESLDLSYNGLCGPIPPQLTELYALSNFRLAHNNLSGRTPDRKNQFGTFDEASYEGNPLLCGKPLQSCDGSNQKNGTRPSINHTLEDDAWREAFQWSFAGSYVVAFLGVVLFLYLNPHYQWLMFDLVRKLVPSFPY